VRAVNYPCGLLIMIFVLHVQVVRGQEEPAEQQKKNPSMRSAAASTSQQDTSRIPAKIYQRPLPKFDLPEYVITGTASMDLPKMEKVMSADPAVISPPITESPGKILRDRETLEMEMNTSERNSHSHAMNYSGYAAASMGTFFTPRVDFRYGQMFPTYSYSVGGNYFLTKGFATATDQSGGGIDVSGGTTVLSTLALLQGAWLDSRVGYRSNTFHFYGSAMPELQRTVSTFSLGADLEHQAATVLPYGATLSLEHVSISDSSLSTSETRFDLSYQTSFQVATIPLSAKLSFMSATGGLGLMDVSFAASHAWSDEFMVEGSLHLSWAKGMDGQNEVRLCPQVTAWYQVTTQHRLFLSYDQMVVPMTWATLYASNRYLSVASVIRQEIISGEGKFGVESMWSEGLQTRISAQLKSVRDLPLFSDSTVPGVWMLAYGGDTRIITFSAEMVAKLNSNDYFSSSILVRSTKDSFLGGKIPYTPAIEAWCSAVHKFAPSISICATIRYAGGRTTDLAGTAALSNYAVIDVSGDYAPWEYVKFSAGIKNLTDTKFETWRGYREFPFTIQFGAQIKW
jgi:hypothetical protein